MSKINLDGLSMRELMDLEQDISCRISRMKNTDRYDKAGNPTTKQALEDLLEYEANLYLAKKG